MPLPPLPFTLHTYTHTRYLYYTAQEARDGIKSALELEADIMTNTGSDTNNIINSNNEEDFNLVGDNDDLINMDMD
jgi:hypothetical protein